MRFSCKLKYAYLCDCPILSWQKVITILKLVFFILLLFLYESIISTVFGFSFRSFFSLYFKSVWEASVHLFASMMNDCFLGHIQSTVVPIKGILYFYYSVVIVVFLTFPFDSFFFFFFFFNTLPHAPASGNYHSTLCYYEFSFILSYNFCFSAYSSALVFSLLFPL